MFVNKNSCHFITEANESKKECMKWIYKVKRAAISVKKSGIKNKINKNGFNNSESNAAFAMCVIYVKLMKRLHSSHWVASLDRECTVMMPTMLRCALNLLTRILRYIFIWWECNGNAISGQCQFRTSFQCPNAICRINAKVVKWRRFQLSLLQYRMLWHLVKAFRV